MFFIDFDVIEQSDEYLSSSWLVNGTDIEGVLFLRYTVIGQEKNEWIGKTNEVDWIGVEERMGDW